MRRCHALSAAIALFALPTAHAATISVNLAIGTNDNNSVNADETAFVGLPGATPVAGSLVNHVQTAGGVTGATTLVSNTQGGSSITLAPGVSLTSSGSFFTNFADVSPNPARGNTGDGGLMQSYLNLNSSESLTVTGLAAYAPLGYQVIAVFDIGPINRTYAVTMTDGTTSQAFWTNDTAGTDADSNGDGLMEWTQTTATTSGSAVTDANYAVFGTFTGDTLTISGNATTGRATLTGFQIITVPEPANAAALAGLGLLCVTRRRRA